MKKLKKGQVIIIKIPFMFTIGEEGIFTGKILETIEDCEDETREHLHAIDPANLLMETKAWNYMQK